MELVSYPALFQTKNQHIEVDFPDLPNAFTQGTTMDEAMDYAKLGLAITINDQLGHFEQPPKPSRLADLQQKYPQATVKMVTVDLDQY